MYTKEFRSTINSNDRTNRFVSKSMGIGDEIIAALERKGMTRRDLADKLGCQESLVSRWLGGLQNFTLRTITHIEEVLEQDLLLTPKKASEKYRKQAEMIVKQIIVPYNERNDDRHSHYEILPHQESYSVFVDRTISQRTGIVTRASRHRSSSRDWQQSGGILVK